MRMAAAGVKGISRQYYRAHSPGPSDVVRRRTGRASLATSAGAPAAWFRGPVVASHAAAIIKIEFGWHLSPDPPMSRG